MICIDPLVRNDVTRCDVLRKPARQTIVVDDRDRAAADHNRGNLDSPAVSLDERRRRMIEDAEAYLADPESEGWVRRSLAGPDEPWRLWRRLQVSCEATRQPLVPAGPNG
ncbi:MAG: hypothetical protein DWQ37_02715 [Planctomycetota bacterium]|nr:MAG: hypothetical protein DWQ37_02715 [Planctomycetota bacterium]